MKFDLLAPGPRRAMGSLILLGGVLSTTGLAIAGVAVDDAKLEAGDWAARMPGSFIGSTIILRWVFLKWRRSIPTPAVIGRE
jgi:hypothetical protein